MAVTRGPEATRDPDVQQGHGWTMLLVGLGGFAGTVVRYAAESVLPAGPQAWPWATFLINVTGTFILAARLQMLIVLGPDDGWRRRVRLGVGTGVLGGYTTYSSFMVEAARLSETQEYFMSFGYVAASLVLGFLAALVGMGLVDAVHRRGVRP